MIVYRDLNIDEWWVYKDQQWWQGCGWKSNGFKWEKVDIGPSLQLLHEEFVVQSTEGDFYNAKGFPIKLQ